MGLVFRGGDVSVEDARGALARFRDGVGALMEALQMEGIGCGTTRFAALAGAGAEVVRSSVALVDALDRGERSEEGVGRAVGRVWESVDKVDKVPMSDLQACGGALVRDLVLVNDVLREMREEMVPSAGPARGEGREEGEGGAVGADSVAGGGVEEDPDSPASVLSETEAEDEAWEEEEGQRVSLGMAVVNGYVLMVKAFLRGTSGSSLAQGGGVVSGDVVDAVERVVACGKVAGVACEALGAGLWPPQECEELGQALGEVDQAARDLVVAAGEVFDGLVRGTDGPAPEASAAGGREEVLAAHAALARAVAAMTASLKEE